MPKRPKRRPRRDRSEILAILTDYRGSGLTQREFARSRKLPLSTLTNWLRRYGEDGRSPSLIPVLSPEPHGATACADAIEIVLANHRVLRIRGDVDPHTLAKILPVVDSSC